MRGTCKGVCPLTACAHYPRSRPPTTPDLAGRTAPNDTQTRPPSPTRDRDPATGTEQPPDWAHYEGELTLKHSASRRRRSRTGRLHKQLQTRSGALPGVIVSSRRAIGRRRVRASRPPRPRLVRPVRRARSRFCSRAQRRSRPAVEATVNRERQRRCPSFATTRSGVLSAVIVSSVVPPGDVIGPRRL